MRERKPELIDFRRFVPSQPFTEAEARAYQHPAERATEASARRRTALKELSPPLPITSEDEERIVAADLDWTLESMAAVRAWMERIDAHAAGAHAVAVARSRGDAPPEVPPRLRNVLALLGDPGRGKTVAAAWLLVERPGGYYVKLDEASQLKTSRSYEDKQLWKRLRAAPVLVVGELGAETDVVLAKAALHQIIDERQIAGRWTLLDGNISEAVVRSRYDARTIDRLERMWRVQVCAGPSLRSGRKVSEHTPSAYAQSLNLAGTR